MANDQEQRPFRVCEACGRLTPSGAAWCSYCGDASQPLLEAEVERQNERRFAEAVEAFERNLLSDALQRSGGNLTQASLELGMAKTTLFDKVKKYGLSH